MANANSQFGGFLTNVGVAKQTNANALQIPWKITRMQLGDGGGEPTQAPDPVPRPDQTALIRVVHDAPLNALYPSPDDPGVLIAELVLPPNIGGFWIRETALRDEDGDLIAVAAPAPSYKPQLNQGSGRTQTIRMHVVFGHTANVQLKIDPSIVLATREYVDRRDSERQPLNARLTTLAQQVMAANQLIYSTGPDEFGMTAFPTFARELIAADTSAKARAKLELRSAALLDATTSVTDRTVGRAVRMGDLGFGQMTGPVNEVDFNNLPTQYPYSGRLPNLYGGVTAKNSPKAGEFFWYLHQHLRTASDGTTSVLQVAFPYRATVDGFWFRSRYQNTWSPWEEIKSARQLAALYAPVNHTHSISQITGLQAALDAAVTGGFSQSFAPTGWRRLPNGNIRQWGTANPAYNGNVTHNLDITLPTTFPNACLECGVNLQNAPWDAGLGHTGIRPISNSQIRIQSGGATTARPTVFWWAEGH